MLQRLGLAEEFNRSRISAYELGKREPSLLVLLKYAQCVNVSTDILIDDKQDLPAWLTKAAKAEAAARGPLQRAKRKR